MSYPSMTMRVMVVSTTFTSPIGELIGVACDGGLTALLFADETQGRALDAPPPTPGGLPEVREQLAAYFAGELEAFDLDLAPSGTPFQKRVWQELERIPFGQTISYAELAERIGKPSAVRAVGGANNKNPCAIVIPCHRVIGKSKSLVGYAGGLARKRALLELENAEFAASRQLELL